MNRKPAVATRCVLAAVAVTMAMAWAPFAMAAGQWTVSRIETRGASDHTLLIELTEPGSTTSNKVRVQLRAKLVAGTTIRVSDGGMIELESPNGEKIRSGTPAGALLLRSADEGGETYSVLGGRWAFNVLKRLDFFNVTTRTVSAQTRGTSFWAELDETAGVARYQVDEGRIRIRHPAPVRIGAAASGTDVPVQVSEMLAAGAPQKTFALTPASYLFEFGNYGDARAYFEARLREAEQANDPDAKVDMLIALGDVDSLLGSAERAVPSYQAAYDIVRGQGDGYWQAVLLGRLGTANQRLGNHREAIHYFEESMALHDRQPALEGEFTVQEQGANLAAAMLASGTYRCAAQFGERTLTQLKALYRGADHPAYASLYATIGSAAYGLGDYRRASEQHELARTILLRLWSPTRKPDGLTYHEEVAAALNALGWDHSALRRFDTAQAEHRAALTITLALFPGPHSLQADAHHGFGVVLKGRGRAAEAVAEHRQALQIQDRAPRDPIRIGIGQLYLGEALLAARQPKDSVDALEQARSTLREKLPDQVHPDFVTLHQDLAVAYRAWGAHEAQAAAAAATAKDLAAQVQAREAACLK
jgi:tetratricopeptide (TPR) repeat protein